MKHFSRIAAGLVLVAIVLLATKVQAADDLPPMPPDGSTASQRIEQRRKERNVQLTDKDKKRLMSKCLIGQEKVSTLKSTTNQAFIARQTQYTDIIGDIWVITGKLKLAGKDTFQLEKQLDELTEKMSKFQTTRLNYQQSLDDTRSVNCQADIIGFKAILDTSRLYYAGLISQSKDIRAYITDTVKTTLASHLSDLQGGQ